MIAYYTEYSNQVHQLNISISQHLYCLKDGTINYQQKAFNVDWGTYASTGKRHLVNCIVRDHFSNAFYGELHTVENMIDPIELLFNAWREKNDYAFRGIPRTLIIPKSLLQKFPRIANLYTNVDDIYLQEATSGFNAGVRIINDWERDLKFLTSWYSDCHLLSEVQHNIEGVNNEMNTRPGSKKREGNIIKWRNGLKQLLMPGTKDHFYNLFRPKESAQKTSAGLQP